MTIHLNGALLRRLFPDARADILDAIERSQNLLEKHGLNATAQRLAHFLAQADAETSALRIAEESGNYSAERLLEIFPRYFTPAQARVYARKPVAILSRAYANRLGNGPESSRDGWTFRGRGMFQMTGRANYLDRGARIGVDLIAKPELAADPVISVKLAIQYWSDLNLNRWADANDVLAVSRAVNGGSPTRQIQPNGMAHRRAALKRIAAVLDASLQIPDPLADGLLTEGEEGEAVRAMQEALARLGYGHILGRADGVFGPSTKLAVTAFQQREELEGRLTQAGQWIVGKYDEALKTAQPFVPEARQGVSVPELRERHHPTIAFGDRVRAWAMRIFGTTVGGGIVATDPSLIGVFTQLKSTSDSVTPVIAWAVANLWWVLPAAGCLLIYIFAVRSQRAEAADYAAMKSVQGD